MIYWLILVAQGGMMHVGNFPDMKACVAAANSVQVIVDQGQGLSPGRYLCIQANTPSTQPPQG